jgi:hypothetical protein
MAAHCTYLAIAPDGVRKLNRRPAKKVWGRYAGGLIPLTRGASNKPLRDAPDDDGCLIAEGIENALAAAWLRPELRAFAGVAVGNLAAIALPEQMANAASSSCARSRGTRTWPPGWKRRLPRKDTPHDARPRHPHGGPGNRGRATAARGREA